MTNVGAVEVTVLLNARDTRKQAKDEGERAGEEFGESFDEGADRGLRRFRRRFRDFSRTIARGVGRTPIFRDINNQIRSTERQLRIFSGRVVAIGLLVGPVLVPLAAAFAEMGPAIALALPALAALGAGIGVLALGGERLKQAFDPLVQTFKDLEGPISNILTAGIRPLVRELSEGLGPIMQAGFGGFARVMNEALRLMLEFAGSARGLRLIRDLFTGIDQAVQPLNAAIQPLTRALLQIAVAALPGFMSLNEAIADLAIRFSDWINELSRSGELTRNISNAVDTLGSVFGFLGNVTLGIIDGLRVLADLFRPLAVLISDLGISSRDAAKWITIVAGAFFALGLPLKLAASLIGTLLTPFRLLLPLFRGIGTVARAVAPAFAAIGRVFAGLGRGAAAAVRAFTGIAAAIRLIGVRLVAVAGLQRLGAMFARLGPLLLRFVAPLGRLGLLLLNLLIPFKALVPLLARFGTLLKVAGVALLGLSGPALLVVAAIVALVAAFVIAWQRSETFRNAITTLGQTLLQWGQIVVTNVLSAARALWQFFQTQILPVLRQTARQVAGNLRPAFQAVAALIRNQLVPAVVAVVAKFREWWPTIQRIIAVAVRLWAQWVRFVSLIAGRVIPIIVAFIVQAFRVIAVIIRVIGAIANWMGAWFRVVGVIVGAVIGAIQRVWGWLNDLWDIVQRVAQVISGAWQSALDGVSGALDTVAGAVETVVGWLGDLADLADRAADALSSISVPDLDFPSLPDWVADRLAEGGIVTRPTVALMGERSKPEAVVPMTKPKRALQIMQAAGLDKLAIANQKQTDRPNVTYQPTFNLYPQTSNVESLAHQLNNRLRLKVGV